jgi:glycosyltransferase involved in cell wall biosynthesis
VSIAEVRPEDSNPELLGRARARTRSASRSPRANGSLRERLGTLTTSLIIPARNEEMSLRQVLGDAIPDFIHEVIVVDGNSVDATRDVVQEMCPRARLISQTGRGKGDALKAGLRAAAGDIAVTMDGDGSHRVSDIHPLIDCLLEGYDFVKGSRSLPGASSEDFTAVRAAGNWALTQVARTLYRAPITDITYGLHAYWRNAFVDAAQLVDGFGFEIQTVIKATRGGLRIGEIACLERPRIGGASKLRPVKDGWGILKVIVGEAAPRRRVAFRPLSDLYLDGVTVVRGAA